MTSERKVRANRTNARASCGPRTAAGRARSARNAFRHGLNVSINHIQQLTPDVERLARKFLDDAADDQEAAKCARAVAEAQIDLRRIRQARNQFLSNAVTIGYYDSRAASMEKLAALKTFLRPKVIGTPLPDYILNYLDWYLGTIPEGPEKFALILHQRNRRCSRHSIATKPARCRAGQN